MDDFLMKLYNEELEKNAGVGQKQIFDALPVSDLETFLGIEKIAVGGPAEPKLPANMEAAVKAKEQKGERVAKEVSLENSKNETTPTRNIAPLKAGETIPERNITKQAFDWADQMGRKLAHMTKEGADLTQAQRNKLPAKSFAVPESKAKKLGVEQEIQGEAKGKYPIPDEAHARNALARVAQHGTPGEKAAVKAKVHAKFPGIGEESEEKDSCAMGKAAAVMRAIKIAHQLPAEMRPALIETTASEMNKIANLSLVRGPKSRAGAYTLAK